MTPTDKLNPLEKVLTAFVVLLVVASIAYPLWSYAVREKRAEIRAQAGAVWR